CKKAERRAGHLNRLPVAHNVTRFGFWIRIKPSRSQPGVADQLSDFRRGLQDCVRARLRKKTVLSHGLNNPASALRGLVNGDRHSFALQIEPRCKPGNPRADYRDGVQIVRECFRSPAGASVLSKHIAMLRINNRPASVTWRPVCVRRTKP